jgi:hypothetical protein
LLAKYRLADRLQKTVAEIEEITLEEWHGWLAYFSIKDKENG